jgi:hypothetical protein
LRQANRAASHLEKRGDSRSQLGLWQSASFRGTFAAWRVFERHLEKGRLMNQLIYLVGLVVVIIAILSFFGLR